MSELGANQQRVFIDGQRRDSLPWDDRGLAYGEGVFETCRLVQGRLPLWGYHRRRLLDSARVLGLALRADWLDRHLPEAIGQTAFGTVKIILTGGSGGRGYARPEPTGRCIVAVKPDQRTCLQDGQSPLRVTLCQTPVSENPRLAGHKHLNRFENVLARAEWEGTRFDEGLIANGRGEWIEATAHNLFVKTAAGWVTPPLRLSGVRGVMRQLILDELAPSLGIGIGVEPIRLPALREAEEAFICNSNRGIRALGELCDLNEKPLARWSVAPQSQMLCSALQIYLNETMGESP